MAATGKTPILLYGSTTATNQPSAGNLTNSSDGCEIAINVADKNLFFKDATNTVNTVPIRQSSGSSDGWLSSANWTTFNSKQAAYTNLTTIGSLANATGWLYNNGSGTFSYSTPSKSDVGLGNVSNDVQTKAAIVPNTVPSTGQILVGNAGGTAYAPVSMSGDMTLASTGAATLATVNSNVGSYTNASVTVNAKGLVTAVSSGTAPVTSVTGTSPVVSSGGTTPAISMAAATGSVNGYLTSTDWTTFNGKQAALVSGTNIKTVNGTSLLGSGDVGTIGVGYGGTGLTSVASGLIPFGSSASALSSNGGLSFSSGYLQISGNNSSVDALQLTGYNGFGHAVALTSATSTASDFIFGTQTNIPIKVYANGGQVAEIFASGGVSIGNTTDPGAANLSVSGNVVIATSGKGIDFSATAGTGTSELLADYEEGTFTPVVFGTTTAGTGTYSSQLGTYTKIGRQVTIQIYLWWTAHTGTGNMQVSGLPYTSNASISAPLSTMAYNLTTSANTLLSSRVLVSNTVIELVQLPTGGGAWGGVAMDTNVDALLITGTYFV